MQIADTVTRCLRKMSARSIPKLCLYTAGFQSFWPQTDFLEMILIYRGGYISPAFF